MDDSQISENLTLEEIFLDNERTQPMDFLSTFVDSSI
jgi:hypothetical protein